VVARVVDRLDLDALTVLAELVEYRRSRLAARWRANALGFRTRSGPLRAFGMLSG
jgi:hypothetical protein